ncbi:MAG: DUF4249 domain-containing protein [Prevotella sp.]|nr:MAG: DUF4249 domain-containing protein [Prevotella sp.]
MRKNSLKTLLALPMLVGLLSACVEEIDTPNLHEPKMVVNCLLTQDSVQKLSLTYTNELGNTAYEEVPQAIATLFEHGREVGVFKKVAYGEWKLAFKPLRGETYTLQIQTPNHPDITANTTFPERLPIQRLKPEDKEGRRAFRISKNADPFWACAFAKDQDTIMRTVVIRPYYTMKEDIATDYPKTDQFNMQTAEAERVNTYHCYIRMLPNAVPTTFTLYPLYSSVVSFIAVSEEYDRYLKSSLRKMQAYESFSDPTQWLEENAVYSNIENGVGIFGAYEETLFNCNNILPE